MKKLTTLCLAACLAAALATPASALDYTIDAPEGPDYGKSTSVEVVHTADGGALKNEDVSKNAALVPPGFGSASAEPGSHPTWPRRVWRWAPSAAAECPSCSRPL